MPNNTIQFITKNTVKTVDIHNINGTLQNTTLSNSIPIELDYNSYVIYLSNPTTSLSFTSFLELVNNTFAQIILFIFIMVIGFLYIHFLKIVKDKGLRGF